MMQVSKKELKKLPDNVRKDVESMMMDTKFFNVMLTGIKTTMDLISKVYGIDVVYEPAPEEEEEKK